MVDCREWEREMQKEKKGRVKREEDIEEY